MKRSEDREEGKGVQNSTKKKGFDDATPKNLSLSHLFIFWIFQLSSLQNISEPIIKAFPWTLLAPSLRARAPQSAPAPAGSPLVHPKKRANVSKYVQVRCQWHGAPSFLATFNAQIIFNHRWNNGPMDANGCSMLFLPSSSLRESLRPPPCTEGAKPCSRFHWEILEISQASPTQR